MRHTTRWRHAAAATMAIGLLATACGSDDGGDSGSDTGSDSGTETTDGSEPAGDVPDDGPTINVGSFGFNESVILAEIYAQVLDANGYPVETTLNIGTRELVFPELREGNINLLPEYAGSALSVGFGGEPTSDLDATLTALASEFEPDGIEVLEAAPGEDKNVFVVTQAYADDNGLTTISDLADLDSVSFTGPPECEERQTCYAGLVDVYGLDNLSFEVEPEGATRVANLESGSVDMTLLFSTNPVIASSGLVPLEDDMGLIAAENIVPVVRGEVIEAYGDDLVTLLNEVSALITTEVLIDLNSRVEIDAENPDDVAAAFLSESGLV